KDTDRRSDVYSLGVLLYEVLAGRRPFAGESSFEIMTRTVNEPVVPPSRFSRVQINPVHFKSLERICLVALAKDRRERYPTAQGFAEDLSRWLRGEAFTVEAPEAHRSADRRRAVRRWGIAAGAALALTAVALGLHFRAGPGVGLPPRTLRPGAVAETFSGTNFNVLGVRRIDSRSHFENRDHPLWSEVPRYWASFRWTGYLEVPTTGTWIFGTESKEGVRLLVDGAPVIVNWGFHPPTRDSGMAALEKGSHKLTLEYYHTTEEQLVRLSWRPEGDGPWTPITPATLFHDPVAFVSYEPPTPAESGPIVVAGAQEGEDLTVLESTGDRPVQKSYDTHRQFWRGHWSGTSQLWWGSRVKPGDRLRLQFRSNTAGRRTLGLALTRASDHGVFRVSVNGKEIAAALDLYDPELRTGELEFKEVDLKAGPNELEFLILGTNPRAREWGPGSGLYKMALDYLVVR
ncbi:MAG TPA: PA14 domain-containing protein, partial [Planctomycetota bacterium]|nr:PA14 domain-containing protein [Planctomycetota bacterium]